MKAIQDQMTIGEMLELRRHDMLKVNAEYQRGAVWKSAQKKRLIDSVLRGYPLPLIYLHHIQRRVGNAVSDRYEVIDGQQRINALYEFNEGAFKLFHPVEDEEEARFPDFVKRAPCPWGGKLFEQLDESLRKQFLETGLSIVKIETDNASEARDLFVRLQAGMPLNAQEKRDAWPGQFTEFVLKLGGKPEIAKYPGHDYFKKTMKLKPGGDRGKIRQLAAQVAMLYFTRRQQDGIMFCDINSQAIDTFYYRNLDFDASSPNARRLIEIMDKLEYLLGDQKRKKLQGHETIHLVLLVDSLWDDYTRSWESNLAEAFDKFRAKLAEGAKAKYDLPPHKYWSQYGMHTRANSDRGDTISRRHRFFAERMRRSLALQPKDPSRAFGQLDREIIYYRDKKACQVCGAEVTWLEAEIHHVDPHAKGGATLLDNGALVHRACHPKAGAAVAAFAQQWAERRTPGSPKRLDQANERD